MRSVSRQHAHGLEVERGSVMPSSDLTFFRCEPLLRFSHGAMNPPIPRDFAHAAGSIGPAGCLNVVLSCS